MIKISNVNPPAGGQISNVKKGFTLVELVLYMGILSVLLSVLVAIFVTAIDVKLESEATSAVQRDGTYILAKLAYDVHRASNISIPATLGTTTTNLKIVIGGVDYTYSVDGSENLTLSDGVATNNLNSFDSKVSALTVKRLGNTGGIEDTLKINFTLTSRTKRTGTAGYEAKNFETNLSLRRQ